MNVIKEIMNRDWSRLDVPCNDGLIYQVPAWKFAIPRFAGMEFALHKSLCEETSWVVCEVSTGRLVAVGNDPKEAYETACKTIKAVGEKKTRSAIRNADRCMGYFNVG